ncbi:trypsin-like peptidase domain-containing protein [Nocardiopsis alborubida]|uniref:Solute-binding protein n=1 Tax=Nocardiopsis alborubida TaxID=146802 RepID=A0A7X6M9Y8_9ACTN|nr:trypsin-like peptidase domain-containing protein [Nocardiopsis alborubida]NKY97094.1 solute-binding protein [Nocardiopsis alborubida]
MDPRYVADVRVVRGGGASRGGTGYLVGPSLVLTAAHVLDGHKRVDVRLGADPPSGFLRCSVIWSDRRTDVALLRLKEPQPHPSVRWGKLSADEPQPYRSLGYPDLAANDGGRDLKDLRGTLSPWDGMVRKDLRLDVKQKYGNDVSWKGSSGTAVFVRERLVGVIVDHDQHNGDLIARRATRFARDRDFRRLVKEDAGAEPWLVPVDLLRAVRNTAKRFVRARLSSLRRLPHTLAGAVRKRCGYGTRRRGATVPGRRSRVTAMTGWERRGTGQPVWPLAVAAVALLTLAPTGMYWLRTNGHLGPGLQCAPPTELTVLTTPDQHAALQRAADDFSAYLGGRDERSGCVPVRVSVTTAGGSARTRELLRDGWSDLRAGPRPHVWLPDSSADITLLVGDPGDAPELELGEEPATRLTPVVLGLPESASEIPACSGTDPGGARSNLVVCTAAAAEAGLLLARPSPEASVSALIQTEALYSAYGDGGAEEIQIAEARATSAGLDAEGNLGLLCALRGGDADPATVGVFSTEYAVDAYNSGGQLGPGCGPTGEEPEEPLVPVYFAETPGLDHPFVRLGWGGDDGVEREVAAFEDWMRRPRATGAFHGYRTVDGDMIGGEAKRSLMEVRHLDSDRDAEEWRERLESGLRQQERSRAPIEVLLVVDRSDSMSGPGTGGTRLATAQELARTAVGLLGEQDTVGVWTFPEGGPGNDVTGQERVLPPEPGMDAPREELAREEIDALVAEFPATPLADAIRDGAEELGSCADRPGEPGACALVVLTDGVALPEPRGGARADDVAAVLDGLDERVRVHVVSVGNEGCGGDALLSRLAGAGAECHHPRADELEQVVYGIVAGTRAATP